MLQARCRAARRELASYGLPGARSARTMVSAVSRSSVAVSRLHSSPQAAIARQLADELAGRNTVEPGTITLG